MEKQIILAVLLTISISAKAAVVKEAGWVATPFWAAPKANKIEMQMVSIDANTLRAQCKEFETRLSYEQSPIDPGVFDKYRTKDYSSDSGFFKAVFVIANNPFSVTGEVKDESNKLPFYYQRSASQQVFIDNGTTISTDSSEDSYSATAKSLNLSETDPRITKAKYKDAIEVNGKDLACDLLNGKAKIILHTKNVVSIDDNSNAYLSDFYLNKIQANINEAFAGEKNNQMVRAALLGFKLSKTLADANVVEEGIEKHIGTIFNLFFEKNTLENARSGLLLDSKVTPGKKEIQLSTSVTTPIEVTLTL
jgi:hypothetical protein